MKSKENYFLLLLFITLPINLTLTGVVLLVCLLINSKKIVYLSPFSISKPMLESLNIYHSPIYIFILISLLQGFFVIDPILHYAGLFAHYIIYFLFFLYFKKSLNSNEKVEQLIKYIVISGFILSVISFLSFYGLINSFKLLGYHIYGAEEYLLNFQLLSYDSFNRKASGFNMNSNIMACYLLLTFYITLISKKFNFFKTNLYYLIMISQFVGIFLTKSRGAILSLFLSLLLLLLFSKKNLIKYYFFLLPFLALFFIKPYQELFTSIFDSNFHSNQLRLITWSQSINIIKDFPLGVGILHYEKIYPAYKHYFEQYIPHAHNWFLHTAIESGIPLTIMLFLSYFYMLFFFFKKLESEYKFISLALFSFFTFNLTDYVLTDTRVCMILVSLIFIGSFLSSNRTIK